MRDGFGKRTIKAVHKLYFVLNDDTEWDMRWGRKRGSKGHTHQRIEAWTDEHTKTYALIGSKNRLSNAIALIEEEFRLMQSAFLQDPARMDAVSDAIEKLLKKEKPA